MVVLQEEKVIYICLFCHKYNFEKFRLRKTQLPCNRPFENRFAHQFLVCYKNSFMPFGISGSIFPKLFLEMLVDVVGKLSHSQRNLGFR